MDKLKQHIQNNLQQLDIEHPKQDLWIALRDELSGEEYGDPLKDHIEQNYAGLDLEMPGENSWSTIESAISSQKPARVVKINRLRWYVAATFPLIFIVAAALLYKNNHSTKKEDNGLVAIPSQNPSPVPDHSRVDTLKEVAKTSSEITDDKDRLNQETREIAPDGKKNDYVLIKRKKPYQQTENNKLPLIIIQAQAAYDTLIAGQVSLIQSIPVYGESAGDFTGFIDDFKKLDNQEKQLRSAVLRKGMEENTLDELGMIYQKKLTVLKMLQREISRSVNTTISENDTIPVFIKL